MDHEESRGIKIKAIRAGKKHWENSCAICRSFYCIPCQKKLKCDAHGLKGLKNE